MFSKHWRKWKLTNNGFMISLFTHYVCQKLLSLSIKISFISVKYKCSFLYPSSCKLPYSEHTPSLMFSKPTSIPKSPLPQVIFTLVRKLSNIHFNGNGQALHSSSALFSLSLILLLNTLFSLVGKASYAIQMWLRISVSYFLSSI